MALVCMLYFVLPIFDMHVMVTLIAGTTNVIADASFVHRLDTWKQRPPNAAHFTDLIPAWPTQFCTDCSFSTTH